MVYGLLFIGILLLDQGTKYLASLYLKGTQGISLIEDGLYLTYVENRGAAFGIFQNQKWMFVILTILILAFFLAYLIKKRPKSKLFLTSFVFIAAGAVGNLIDRIRLSYVIDMVDVRLIHFPVFNVADSFVVIGTVLLCIYILRGGRKSEVEVEQEPLKPEE